jgi:glycosyltransferase involved in cell wall biosynthesis
MAPLQQEVTSPRPGDELVSVIIPSYNMARFLPQAVDSVLAQTYKNIEIQIIDDGSKDNTPDVIRRWDGNPRVRVHRQVNGGLSHARNQGIALTRGDFVALLDADDIWLPQKLALQMPLFRGRPEVGVVYSDYVRMDEEGKPLPNGPTRMHRGRISGPLLIENFVPASTALVRRACFERCGGFDVALRTGEDYEMWLRLSAHFQFEFVPEATMRYRTGGWQMSTDYRGRYETAIRVMQGFLDRNPGTVDRGAVRSAWAHTYTGRGNVTLWRGHDRRRALRDYFKALSFRPGYWPAWRAILRSFITSNAPSAG